MTNLVTNSRFSGITVTFAVPTETVLLFCLSIKQTTNVSYKNINYLVFVNTHFKRPQHSFQRVRKEKAQAPTNPSYSIHKECLADVTTDNKLIKSCKIVGVATYQLEFRRTLEYGPCFSAIEKNEKRLTQ